MMEVAIAFAVSAAVIWGALTMQPQKMPVRVKNRSKQPAKPGRREG